MSPTRVDFLDEELKTALNCIKQYSIVRVWHSLEDMDNPEKATCYRFEKDKEFDNLVNDMKVIYAGSSYHKLIQAHMVYPLDLKMLCAVFEKSDVSHIPSGDDLKEYVLSGSLSLDGIDTDMLDEPRPSLYDVLILPNEADTSEYPPECTYYLNMQ
ncbi:hypothetical protein IWW36_002873 [Coemansia brasiliensis]|uniref:Uncharacterized protein n=1 Tax=Coemansia brasiliensis TaxID=2650707 RepID=A0A9W8LXR7_9FUNG|nr:hypothetical protein IWW36_002873 [Coemansia brasiliensis]